MSAGRGWLLYGCRTPYAIEAAEVIVRRGERVELLVDNAELGTSWTGAEEGIDPTATISAPVVGIASLPAEAIELAAAVPLVTPGLRHAAAVAAEAGGLRSFPPLVDPTAVVAASAELDSGTLVNAGALIAGEARLGRFVLINRGTSIGHHNRIGDFAAFGPGSILAGNVTVGRGAFVGAGAVCAPKVTVGANAVVGAGTVVIADVPPGTVVVGNPARAIGEVEGYEGFAVPA